jgi:nucleoside-diphosphate-sugar epimerase
MTAGTVLVTGASGLLGAEVTARLAAAGHPVLALLHDRSVVVRNDGRRLEMAGRPAPGSVAAVRGDVTTPGLGIDPASPAIRDVRLIVHAAAVTDFGRTAQLYERVNVRGTANVLEFARSAATPLPVVYVSTAYVCGERTGEVREDELDVGQSFTTPYESSKLRAERLVRTSGVRHAVVRPSIVVGAERTGQVREFQNMYIVIRLLTAGRVRSIPGHYDALLDLVPVDYVADVVTAVACRFDAAAGQTFHAIGRRPHSLRDFSDVLAEYPCFHVPRYIPPASFSAEDLPPGERVYYERIVALYASFFRRRAVFLDTATAAFLGRRPRNAAKPFLRRLLDYALKVGYLGSPLPSVGDVLTGLSGDGTRQPVGGART